MLKKDVSSINTTNVNKIPQELKELPQWVVYRSKKPFDPKAKRPAKANDPKTWGTFEQAQKSCRKYGYEGIGFEFNGADPYCGIDLDKCRNPVTGEIEKWARDIVDQIDSYCEISPSGTGLHIIARGNLPPGGNRKGQVEMYNQGRYFTMTGQILDNKFSINERQERIRTVHSNLFDQQKQQEIGTVSDGSPLQIADRDLIEKACGAQNGEKFKRLWDGDVSDYNSPSEADQALCNMLAFWTGRNQEAIERLFKESGLYREKWERNDYRQSTIRLALESCKEMYTWGDTSSNSNSRSAQNGSISITGAQTDFNWHPVITCLEDIVEEPVKWLWPGYMAFGKVCIVEGDPSHGKTWLSLAIATAVSNGWSLPDSVTGSFTKTIQQVPAEIIYMTAEDGLADTIKPRLTDMGADCTRIHVIEGKLQGDGLLQPVSMQDLDVLEQALREIKPVLLIIDPLQAFLGPNVDMNRANSTRPILTQIAKLAEEHNCAVLIIRHLNKASSGKAAYRGMGSIDFTAAARTVLLVGKDPFDESIRLVIPTKCNIGIEGVAVSFSLSAQNGFEWVGKSERTAEEVLYSKSGNVEESDQMSALDQAIEFLEDILSDGAKFVKDVEEKAENMGINLRTLRRAREKLGVEPVRWGKVHMLRLPQKVVEQQGAVNNPSFAGNGKSGEYEVVTTLPALNSPELDQLDQVDHAIECGQDGQPSFKHTSDMLTNLTNENIPESWSSNDEQARMN